MSAAAGADAAGRPAAEAPGPREGARGAECLLAVPFDIDIELDFEALAARCSGRPEGVVEPPLTGRNAPFVTHRGRDLAVALDLAELARDAREEVWIYPFEVGLILIRFRAEPDLAVLADLACKAERIEVKGRPIYAYCDERAEAVRTSLKPFSSDTYETRYDERDVYPIMVLAPGFPGLGGADGGDAEAFLKAHEARILGIVGGEDQWERLSRFALEKGGVRNLGYYSDEVIVAKEWGALISSRDEEAQVTALVLLAYAQRWALQSYNHLTNHRQEEATKLLAAARVVRRRMAIFRGREIQRLASHLFEASADRMALVSGIRDFTSVPELTQDWHFHGLYQELSQTFIVPELYRVVLAKNDDLERAYATIHDHLAESRVFAIEVLMVVQVLLEGLLLLVWFLQEVPH